MSTTTVAGATAPATGPTQITKPGVYDIPADVYHADPVPGGSLSSSGARRLLPPSCPALFKHEQDHGQAPKREFDLGHAAHQLVLGTGPELVVVDAPDWRTKAAREQRDEARARGAVPLKRPEFEQVQAMADAIRQHPVAGALFTPGTGRAEQSLFWIDAKTGIWRRARPDWIKNRTPGKRLILADYKTCRSAAPEALERDIHTYGYHQQAAWYLDGALACGLAEPDGQAAFVFIFQEKEPPYLVTVAELSASALRIGKAKNRRAIDTYATCRTTGRWPAYSDGIELLSLPAWAENRDTEEYL